MCEDFITALMAKGMYNLVWVTAAVQVAAWYCKLKLKEKFSGLTRFAIIYGFTTFLGTVVLLYSGVSFKEAFAMANWLAQAQVAAHQAYKTSTRKSS